MSSLRNHEWLTKSFNKIYYEIETHYIDRSKVYGNTVGGSYLTQSHSRPGSIRQSLELKRDKLIELVQDKLDVLLLMNWTDELRYFLKNQDPSGTKFIDEEYYKILISLGPYINEHEAEIIMKKTGTELKNYINQLQSELSRVTSELESKGVELATIRSTLGNLKNQINGEKQKAQSEISRIKQDSAMKMKEERAEFERVLEEQRSAYKKEIDEMKKAIGREQSQLENIKKRRAIAQTIDGIASKIFKK